MSLKQILFFLIALSLIVLGINSHTIIPSHGIALFMSFLCGIAAGGFLSIALREGTGNDDPTNL